jgi:hypothetical protein
MKPPSEGQANKVAIERDTLMPKPNPNSPVNRKKAQIMRERAQEASATQAQRLAQQRA